MTRTRADRHRLGTQTTSDDDRSLAAYRDELLATGTGAGLDVVGVTEARPWPDARRRLEDRKAAGLAADMAFTYRNPARATDPTRSLPDARTLVVGAHAYRRRRPPRPGTAGTTDTAAAGPTAQVAAYAWIEHYEPLRTGLKAIARRLKDDGWRARILIDDNGLVDREAAQRAGLGWFGKNANLLVPGRGSWFVLGAVLTSAPLPTHDDDTVADGCGPCRRCLDSCPTQAIVAPGVVDARRCLSWLLQADGDFPEAYREALGDRIYGCDDCQDVCPPNKRGDDVDPPPAEPDAVAEVPVLELLTATDDELLARHGRWYLPRRDPDHLRRNALVVLGNVGDPADPRTTQTLDRYRHHPNPVLRRHAEWAAGRIDARHR